MAAVAVHVPIHRCHTHFHNDSLIHPFIVDITIPVVVSLDEWIAVTVAVSVEHRWRKDTSAVGPKSDFGRWCQDLDFFVC